MRTSRRMIQIPASALTLTLTSVTKMTITVLPVVSALIFYSTPAQAYCSYYYGCGNRVTGGGIAGIVVACVVFFLLLLACCMMGMRRRRTYYNNGGQGTWYPVSRGGVFPAGPPPDAEAGYNSRQQPAGWNANAPPASGNRRMGWLNSGFAPSGAPSGSANHWYSEGPGAVPPPYEAKQPQYAPPPGEPPAAYVPR
ncbi:hypothetical protein DAEQUDRAFT_732707 [Daedalea quercina L-15889]|uniref:Uncharacterized protein n=1 Tax=Daedalea quercina L-15889 TaxID=1314783 RepID=A0A165LGT0_9APHY|nr:hypothetical protein DAEQUDRAFT_732707 [Daedalea quercina L-15889]